MLSNSPCVFTALYYTLQWPGVLFPFIHQVWILCSKMLEATPHHLCWLVMWALALVSRWGSMFWLRFWWGRRTCSPWRGWCSTENGHSCTVHFTKWYAPLKIRTHLQITSWLTFFPSPYPSPSPSVSLPSLSFSSREWKLVAPRTLPSLTIGILGVGQIGRRGQRLCMTAHGWDYAIHCLTWWGLICNSLIWVLLPKSVCQCVCVCVCVCVLACSGWDMQRNGNEGMGTHTHRGLRGCVLFGP